MRLFYSKASPFARKVRASAILLGLDRQIELVETNPFADPTSLLEANPLGLIPTLVTEDGSSFFDSRVICEYLNDVATGLPIIPPAGATRWMALRLQGLGDGLMDAAVLRRKLAALTDSADQPLAQRQKAVIARTLDALETQPLTQHVDIGHIAVACALGYLDFRFPDEPWRPSRPALAAWFVAAQAEHYLQATRPEI
ncbi:glutathione S-transferase N-terminal domain-containing protein [Lichenicoccus sp.]|uniref:glutathione S-transferase N-terminal domain-containing protein n=1 Tax=Lichenicoccus sp. TaxID=2781899 RepID=UPI003D0E4483